jgi:C4-dicarboxylate-specific signal transduction histidine kinase
LRALTLTLQSEYPAANATGTNTMTEAITVDRPPVAKAKPATVSASALALHLDCSQTYIRKLEAEGVLHRAPGGSVRLRRADGEFRWYHVRGEPLRDRQGRIIQWYSLDIDEAKKAEDRLRRSEANLAEAQLELAYANGVATMGQLTASITHEVNQPITAAVTYALAARRFLSAEPPNFREVDDALSLIVKEGNRAGEVVRASPRTR